MVVYRCFSVLLNGGNLFSVVSCLLKCFDHVPLEELFMGSKVWMNNISGVEFSCAL